MKLLLATLLAASSWHVLALTLNCVTEIPTTSVVSEVENDEFVVHVIHHFGYEYMPIQTGIVTPHDLPALADKAEQFSKLGNHYVFRWKLEKCRQFDKDIMSCGGGEPTEINGAKISPWSVYTIRRHSEFDIAEYDQIDVAFNLSIDGVDRHFSMQYMANECMQDERARKLLVGFK